MTARKALAAVERARTKTACARSASREKANLWVASIDWNAWTDGVEAASLALVGLDEERMNGTVASWKAGERVRDEYPYGV